MQPSDFQSGRFILERHSTLDLRHLTICTFWLYGAKTDLVFDFLHRPVYYDCHIVSTRNPATFGPSCTRLRRPGAEGRPIILPEELGSPLFTRKSSLTNTYQYQLLIGACLQLSRAQRQIFLVHILCLSLGIYLVLLTYCQSFLLHSRCHTFEI